MEKLAIIYQTVFLLMILSGSALAQCNCQNTGCTNIHSCYNCDTPNPSSCSEPSVHAADEATCRSYIVSGSSYTRALYLKSTQTCYRTDSSCNFLYSTSYDVLFFRNCFTGCNNYTVTMQTDTIVNALGSAYTEHSSVKHSSRCLEKCLPFSQTCTATFKKSLESCIIYSGSCGGSCTTTYSSGWDFYTITCNTGLDCPELTAPTNGVLDKSEGTSVGASAHYTCNAGYTINGSPTITCTSGGIWSPDVPTCNIVSCGVPTPPINGFLIGTSFNFGSDVSFNCLTGYTFSGSSSTKCQANGLWTTYNPVCSPVDCGQPPDLINGNVVYATTTYTSKANYYCATGYTLVGNSQSTCTHTAIWWSAPPTCNPIDCGTPSSITNGIVSYISTTFTSQASYSCNAGYTISGTQISNCGADGLWDSTVPTCIQNIINCGSLSNPLNGNVTYLSTTPSSTASFSCSSGFTIAGSSTLTCGSDGSWSNPAPTCNAVDCGPLSDPVNGNISISSTTFNSLANFTCNTGYILNGSSVRRCDENGIWDSASPNCILINCGTPSSPVNGNVTYSFTTYNSVANFSCDIGFTMNGSSPSVCLSTGSWHPPTPTCTVTDCGPLNDPINGNVAYISTTYNSQANFTCNVGHLINGSADSTCGLDGYWSSSDPSCDIIDCGALSDPVHGNVTYISTTYLSNGSYNCMAGYYMFGLPVTTCRLDGSWDTAPPLCNPIDCGTLTAPIFGSVVMANTTYGSYANYTCISGYSVQGLSRRECLANGSWASDDPQCIPVDCGPLASVLNGHVHYLTATTYNSLAIFSCDPGYTLSHTLDRRCGETSLWSGTTPTCVLAGGPTTTPAPLISVYIMPCICHTNKSFVNMTQEQIIHKLINETKIDVKKTQLAKSKLESKGDPRSSSKMIGFIAMVTLSVLGGLIVISDIITVRNNLLN